MTARSILEAYPHAKGGCEPDGKITGSCPISGNFTLATRAITVLIILINTVPNFKLGLFIILLGLMLLWMIILIKSHQFIARLDEELGNKEQLISEATEIQMIAASKNNS